MDKSVLRQVEASLGETELKMRSYVHFIVLTHLYYYNYISQTVSPLMLSASQSQMLCSTELHRDQQLAKPLIYHNNL